MLRSKYEEFSARLRIVDVLGPSSIPPVVVSKGLDDQIKCKMQEALVMMHLDEHGASGLRQALIERFVAAVNKDYEDIRRMLAKVEGVEFPFE